MNTIGNGKPAGIQSYSHAAVKQANHENQQRTQKPEPEPCNHQPDGMQLNKDNEIVSECEHCGQPLIAAEISKSAVKNRGELYIKKWREDTNP